MSSRLMLAVFLVAVLVTFGAARPQQQPGRQGGNQPGTLPGSTTPPPPSSGSPVNPNPSLTPSQLVDAQGAPINCPCQATQEYNPVCGSNGATYNNPSKLRCAQRCGHNVELTFYGQCPAQRS